MIAFFWFVLGLWVGVSAGIILFACLQVSRDGERPKYTAPQDATEHAHPTPSQQAFIALEIEKLKTFAANARASAALASRSVRSARTARRHVLSYPETVAHRLR